MSASRSASLPSETAGWQRDDGTLLLHADQMVRDSNYDLSLSFNTSMLPHGEYRVRVEGYPRRGKVELFAEARMRVSGR